MTAQNIAQHTTLGQLAELMEYYWETRQKIKELEINLELTEGYILQAFRANGMAYFEVPHLVAHISDSGKLIVEQKGEG